MPKNRNSCTFRLKDGAAAVVLRGVLQLSALFPLEVARGFGRSVAKLIYRANTYPVRVVRTNVALAYPDWTDDQREELVRDAVVEQGALLLELGHVWRRPLAYVVSRLRVVGIEHLDAAAAHGSGVLVLAPHVGNWEVIPYHLVTQGEFLGLFEPPKLPSIGEVVLNARQRPGGA